MSKKIKIIFKKGGGMKYEMEGFIGDECFKEAEYIRKLGNVESEEETLEALLTEDESENLYEGE